MDSSKVAGDDARSIISAIDRALSPLLKTQGFRRRARLLYVKPLPNDLFGTLGLATKAVGAKSRPAIDVFPSLGIGHKGVSECAARFLKGVPADRASVSIGLGYLTPRRAWTGYTLSSANPDQVQAGIAPFLRDYMEYGDEFHQRHRSLEDLIESMCEIWGGDLVSQDLPIAYCLTGAGQRAREYIAGYVGSKAPGSLRQYVPFLENLRSLLPAPVDGDPVLGTDAIAALREILPSGFTYSEVIRFWRHFVHEVETGCDRTFSEYQNSIGLRELLESVVKRVPGVNGRLRAELASLDVAFQAATHVADDDSPPLGAAWWWRRVPLRPGPRLDRSLRAHGMKGIATATVVQHGTRS